MSHKILYFFVWVLTNIFSGDMCFSFNPFYPVVSSLTMKNVLNNPWAPIFLSEIVMVWFQVVYPSKMSEWILRILTSADKLLLRETIALCLGYVKTNQTQRLRKNLTSKLTSYLWQKNWAEKIPCSCSAFLICYLTVQRCLPIPIAFFLLLVFLLSHK